MPAVNQLSTIVGSVVAPVPMLQKAYNPPVTASLAKEVTEKVPHWSPGNGSRSPFSHSESPAHSSLCFLLAVPSFHVPLPHPGSLSFQFLILCFLVQPRSYTDTSILSLMELLCRAGLDVGLRLLPKTDLQQLLLLLLENIQEWPGKVPQPGP